MTDANSLTWSQIDYVVMYGPEPPEHRVCRQRDMHADCEYWGLTRGQCARYHRRLAGYWGRRRRAAAWAYLREMQDGTQALEMLVSILMLLILAIAAAGVVIEYLA